MCWPALGWLLVPPSPRRTGSNERGPGLRFIVDGSVIPNGSHTPHGDLTEQGEHHGYRTFRVIKLSFPSVKGRAIGDVISGKVLGYYKRPRTKLEGVYLQKGDGSPRLEGVVYLQTAAVPPPAARKTAPSLWPGHCCPEVSHRPGVHRSDLSREGEWARRRIRFPIRDHLCSAVRPERQEEGSSDHRPECHASARPCWQVRTPRDHAY